MSTYIYSIQNDTPNGSVNQSQLMDEIIDSSISQTLQNITIIGDAINIYYLVALTGGEETTLTGILNSHIPDFPDLYSMQNIAPQNTAISTTTYKENGVFYFSGNNVINPIKITSTSCITSAGTYSIRIFDLTNTKIICEASLNNTTEGECDLGTISNTTRKKAKWQIQTKGNKTGTIKNIALYY